MEDKQLPPFGLLATHRKRLLTAPPIKRFPAWLPVHPVPRDFAEYPPTRGSIAHDALELYRFYERNLQPGRIPSLIDVFRAEDRAVERLQVSRISEYNRDTNRVPRQSTIVYAGKRRTGFELGDATVADRLHVSGQASRKRKAEDVAGPGLAERGSGYNCGQAQGQHACKGRHSSKFTRPMLGATAKGCVTAMKSLVNAVWSAGLSRLFRSDALSLEERRTDDSRTGNDICKRRKLSEECRWITEIERQSLYARRDRLITALGRASTYISRANISTDEHPAAFNHIDFSLYASLVPTLSMASSTLELFYSADLLSHLTALYKTPEAKMLYAQNAGEQLRIEATIALLEELHQDIWQILDSFDVSKEHVEEVCNDLRAIVAHRPIPSLSFGFSGETSAHHAALRPLDGTLSNKVLDDKHNENVDGTSARIREHTVSVDPIPGAFPVEPAIAVGRTRSTTATADVGKTLDHDGTPKRPRAGHGKEDSPLSWAHETIPMEMVKSRLLSSEFVNTYGVQGKLTQARHREAPRPRGIMLSPLQRPSPNKIVSPRRKGKIAHRNRKKVKWDPFDTFYRHSKSGYSPGDTPCGPLRDLDMSIDEDKENVQESSTSSASSISPPSPSTGRASSSPLRHSSRNSLSRYPRTSPTVAKTSIRRATARSRFDGYLVEKTSSASSSNANEGDDNSSATSDTKASYSRTSGSTSILSDYELSARATARSSILSKLKPAGLPFSSDRDLSPDSQKARFATKRDSLHVTSRDDRILGSQIEQLTISDEKEGDLGDHGAQRQLQSDETDYLDRQEREKRAEEQRRQAEEERLRETGGLRNPAAIMVSQLTENWQQQIMGTVSGKDDNKEFVQTKPGNSLKRRDFAKLIPPKAWLNDEIINGALEWLEDAVNASDQSSGRKLLSMNSFVWPRIKSGQSTERVLRRAGVPDSKSFLKLETVLVPICAGHHWTLVVVRPHKRTVAHMDSLDPSGSPSVVRATMKWVQTVCGAQYVEGEWKIVKHDAPVQTNGWDCGVHVITNGMCMALGLSPVDTYESAELPLQRLRIAGMLLNKGFTGEFALSQL